MGVSVAARGGGLIVWCKCSAHSNGNPKMVSTDKKCLSPTVFHNSLQNEVYDTVQKSMSVHPNMNEWVQLIGGSIYLRENFSEFCNSIGQEPRNLETPDLLTNRIAAFSKIL